MIAKEQERLYTAGDLANMPERDKRYELVQGHLIEKPLLKREHGIISANLIWTLGAYIQSGDLGQLFTSVGFIFAENPDTVYGMDISFFTKAHAVPITEEYCDTMPDLAIEVISPDDTADEMKSRIAAYFGVGVKEIWLVYPETRTIEIYHSPKAITVLDVNDTLESDTLLPGFSVPVRGYFAVLPDSAQS